MQPKLLVVKVIGYVVLHGEEPHKKLRIHPQTNHASHATSREALCCILLLFFKVYYDTKYNIYSKKAYIASAEHITKFSKEEIPGYNERRNNPYPIDKYNSLFPIIKKWLWPCSSLRGFPPSPGLIGFLQPCQGPKQKKCYDIFLWVF